MNPFVIFDYIGHYGPIILFTVTFYSLLHRNKYLYVYVIGSIMNNFMNIFLKNTFKEERPKNPLPFIDSNELIKNNYYGLPSGHAQNVFFSLTFLYLTKAPISYLCSMSCVAIITLCQRLKYRRHDVKQIMVGALTGIFFAWVLVFTTKKYTHIY